MTRGFADRIPVHIQQVVEAMVEVFVNQSENIGNEVDYLQVFELSVDTADFFSMQAIAHSREEPPYSTTTEFVTDTAITEKVYIISDDYGLEGEVITYLLASEY
ncbi:MULTISPECIES: DUF960 family protein [unclassified Fusibacter]|uniref:DUF960 family protein n=1 Tax=unclassified Fusibacter TaxID=2624464 RepID=UPI0010115B1B|nr:MULTISPECIES: DUF960 family protein [unclassified Fusibacter]MCK8058904.1 DUF960 domain-containing protein [Fusibacter sp. A2]NPE21978.1 hypothetical protein [Fusibacter sp. A1]RXV61546.1 hypothetical protein DWB64_09045 [Fusibacter sp. A1]